MPLNYVFLSYGRPDVAPSQDDHPDTVSIVERVYNHLKALNKSLGIEPWYDKRDLPSVNKFTDEIERAIESSQYLLLFIGPHALQSEWCKREWMHALKNCVPVIPILIRGDWADLEDNLPSLITQRNGIDATKLPIKEVLSDIVRLLNIKTPTLTIPWGAKKLGAYLDRPQYINQLKQKLGIGDRNPNRTIIGISSEQEVAAMQGTGGIGKTTIAHALCNDCEVRQSFDEIIFLEVGREQDKSFVPNLMRIIGQGRFNDSADNYPDLQTSRLRLQYYLQGKRSLIVLDDVWNEGIVEEFLFAGIDCRLLITTRKKTLANEICAVSKLSRDEGVRLMALVFDSKNPTPEVLDETFYSIVEKLDGYALAVELAARWLKKYGKVHANDYLARLESSQVSYFEYLLINEADKNANLELSLSLSYIDLEDSDKARFRALGIFAPNASFSLEALETVWDKGDSFIEAQTLVDAGLLEQRDDLRFEQHSLLRAYARKLLEEQGEFETTFERFSDFFTEQAGKFEKLELEKWKDLDEDLPHIIYAGDGWIKHFVEAKPERPLAFALKIRLYLYNRRELQRISWLEMGLKASRILNRRDYESIFLSDIGRVWSDLGEKQKALDFFTQDLEISRELGNRKEETTTLTNIGAVWSDLGDKRKALDYYNQALDLAQEAGDKIGAFVTLNNIGLVLCDLGQKQEGLNLFNLVLPHTREIGNKTWEAATLNNIGRALDDLGKIEEAHNFYEQALQIRLEVGDKAGEAASLNNKALTLLEMNQKQEALQLFNQALLLTRTISDKKNEAATLHNLALAWSKMGEKSKR